MCDVPCAIEPLKKAVLTAMDRVSSSKTLADFKQLSEALAVGIKTLINMAALEATRNAALKTGRHLPHQQCLRQSRLPRSIGSARALLLNAGRRCGKHTFFPLGFQLITSVPEASRPWATLTPTCHSTPPAFYALTQEGRSTRL